MDEDINPGLGISRRDLMRRGAVVGGTLVWAAPAVQSISRAALAATDGTPAPDGDCRDIGYLALVISNGETYQFKLNAGGPVETANPMNAPQCPDPEGWNAGGNIGGYPDGTSWDITSDPCCWSVTIPTGYTLVGVAMGAGGDHTAQGYCVDTPTSNGGQTYTFCAPAR